MPSKHTPAQPSRESFDGEDLKAYEGVVARQRAYNYVEFAKMFPAKYSDVVNATLLESAGDEAGEDRVQPYMGAMLNNPQAMYHISELGVVLRNVGERGDSYSHADREWVDMVISEELGCLGVYYVHMTDAVAVGVRPGAIRALRDGRDEDLTREELIKARYIRQFVRGTVTPESYEAVVKLFGRRGAVEYSQVIGFLLMTERLIQAFGAQTGYTSEMIDEMITEVENGTATLPNPGARVPDQIKSGAAGSPAKAGS